MENTPTEHYNFIDYLRVAGMFLVAWPHLTANLNPSWPSLTLVQWAINRPLSIIQNFGALGVSIFFLISGFLMCEPSSKAPKGPLGYLFYKVLGIFLPLWGAMFTFFVTTKLGELLFGWQCWWTQFSPLDWIKSVTLYNHISGTTDLVNGPLWFLFPLILAIILEALYRIYKSAKPSSSLKFVVFAMVIITFCFYLYDFLPPQICANLVYIPIMLWGYLINLRHHGLTTQAKSLVSGVFCYILILVGFYRFSYHYYEEEPYILSAILGVFIFLIMYLTNSTAQPPKIVKFFSSISYSFYVVHSLWGGLIISALYPHVPYGIALFCGLSVSVAMSYINYSYIERPIKIRLVHFAERLSSSHG